MRGGLAFRASRFIANTTSSTPPPLRTRRAGCRCPDPPAPIPSSADNATPSHVVTPRKQPCTVLCCTRRRIPPQPRHNSRAFAARIGADLPQGSAVSTLPPGSAFDQRLRHSRPALPAKHGKAFVRGSSQPQHRTNALNAAPAPRQAGECGTLSFDLLRCHGRRKIGAAASLNKGLRAKAFMRIHLHWERPDFAVFRRCKPWHAGGATKSPGVHTPSRPRAAGRGKQLRAAASAGWRQRRWD